MLAQVLGLLLGQLVEEESEDVQLLVRGVLSAPLGHPYPVGLLQQEVFLLIVHHNYVFQLPAEPAEVLHVAILESGRVVPV